MLFVGLVDPKNRYMGQTLWTSVASDATQRSMLLAASEAAIGLDSKDCERIAWTLKQTDKLAIYRNDVVHGATGYRISQKGVTTRLAYAGNSFSRVYRHAQTDTPLDVLSSVVRGDLMALSGYVMGVWRSADAGQDRPLNFERPRRPQLKTLRLIEANKRRVREEADRETRPAKKSKSKAKARKSGGKRGLRVHRSFRSFRMSRLRLRHREERFETPTFR